MIILPNTQLLDDVEKISRIDKDGMLNICLKTDKMTADAIKFAREAEFPRDYTKCERIVVLGMGGSSIGGELLRDWLLEKSPIPIETCNDYELPAYINEDSLVFAISYSGETEETLTAFIEAYKRKCKIFAITSGGHLKAFCERLNVPFLAIPKGFAPRAALPYMFFPMAIFAEKMGLVKGIANDLEETVRIIKEISEENDVKKPFRENSAKKMAFELYGTIPAIYGFRHYSSVAHRWKTQLNENSKVACKYEVFPELNHNEVVGWEASEKTAKQFSIVLLRDSDEPEEIKMRIEIAKAMAFKNVGKVLEVKAKGKSKLAKMFSLLHFGDLVSIYLAILNEKDPTPVKMISAMKAELRRKLRTIEKLELEVEKLSVKS